MKEKYEILINSTISFLNGLKQNKCENTDSNFNSNGRKFQTFPRKAFIKKTGVFAWGLTILPGSIVSGLGHSVPRERISKNPKANSSSAFFVKQGKEILLDDYFLYGHVRKENNYLAVYSGTRKEFPQYPQHYCTIGLLGGLAIRDGDFHISAKIRPILLDKTKDQVKIGTYYYDFELMLSIRIGTHYYDFELTKRSIIYLGRMLDQGTFQHAEDNHPINLPEDDKIPFEINIIRKSQTITIKVNGTIMSTCQIVPFPPGDIAIEVGNNFPDKPKSVLHLYDFYATGFLYNRSLEEKEWRQKVVFSLRQVRRIGNAFGYIKDDPALPRILIIGDSISLYYMDPVRTRLKGRANIHRIPDNGQTTTHGIKNLQNWLDKKKWDVIHFNWGLWDMSRTTPEDYQKNLKEIIHILEATGAQLIWANTTPVPKETKTITNDTVIRYNLIAEQIMKKNNIRINDLYSYMLPYSDQYKLYTGNIHFNMEGSSYLGEKVSKALIELLNN